MKKQIVSMLMMVISLFILSVNGETAFGNEVESPETFKSDAYVFPIRPGMDEWKNLETVGEMYKVTQIPETILHNMTTEGLIETCLNYPLLINVFAYNSIQQGFSVVAANFNGMQELLSREDAAKKLLERYRKKAPDSVLKSRSASEQEDFVIDFVYLELFLSQDKIISGLSSDDHRTLVKDALQKLKVKAEYPKSYGAANTLSIGLMIKNVMDKESFMSSSKRSNSQGTELNEDKFVLSNIHEILSDAEAFVGE